MRWLLLGLLLAACSCDRPHRFAASVGEDYGSLNIWPYVLWVDGERVFDGQLNMGHSSLDALQPQTANACTPSYVFDSPDHELSFAIFSPTPIAAGTQIDLAPTTRAVDYTTYNHFPTAGFIRRGGSFTIEQWTESERALRYEGGEACNWATDECAPAVELRLEMRQADTGRPLPVDAACFVSDVPATGWEWADGSVPCHYPLEELVRCP